MMSNAGCSTRRLAVLVIATRSLTGCVTVGSEVAGLDACPPVVEYSRKFQSRAAEEFMLLPEPSAVAKMLSDYAILREQGCECF